MKQITIYDVAQEAGVSVATVSRVLNNTAPVRDTTRAKIMSIIEQHQFQPNALARSLLKKETGTIGVIVPDITNPFFPEVIRGIELEARDKGYSFFLCDTHGLFPRESEYLNILREKQVDGIIFLGGRINQTRVSKELVEELVDTANRIPLVLANGNLPGASLYRVITNEIMGAEMATKHLIDDGHRHIAFIAGNYETTTTSQKVRAFKKVMQDNGLKVPAEYVLYGDFSMRWGQRAMERLLQMSTRPTAVFCVNDFTAVGAVRAAMKSGISIPEEISIVGYDDIPLASAIYPQLTTVMQQSELLGSTAMNVLHRLITKEKVKKLTVIEPKMVVRESTASRPADKKRTSRLS